MPTLRLLPDLERDLQHIPGVRAASVVTAADGVPTEVHVLARPGKAPKQLVRDVQSVALTRHDLDIDHRIVSVVQMDDEELTGDAGEQADSPRGRLELAAIVVRTGGVRVEACVTVAGGDVLHEGQAFGSPAVSNRGPLVARATLDAAAKALNRPADMESCVIASTGQREVALTVVTLFCDRDGEEVLVGSALVRGDLADAVSRSVLDALNRRLTR
jgi:hypothetical protein